MENAMKIVLLAVTVIIVAVLIVAAFSLVNSGQSLLSTGKSQVNNSMKDYAEAAYTQYDSAIVSGSQVIGAVKNEWKPDNTVAVIVCTRDGKDIIYDYASEVTASISAPADEDGEALRANLPNDSKGNPLSKSGSNGRTQLYDQVKKYDNTTAVSSAVPTLNKNTGYFEGTRTKTAGYITRNADFKGTVSRDQNGNIRLLTFVQQ